MKRIDLATWKRKEHFQYFSGLDDPYWSMVTELDCTQTFRQARQDSASFFLSYLHKTMLAANQIEELRTRIVGDEIICYDQLNASVTILREDETFGCCFVEFCDDFSRFCVDAMQQIELVKKRSGMCLEEDYRLDQIHYSSIPWRSFSGLTYARQLKSQDSVPKITFGRTFQSGDNLKFAVAIQVHHGLVDGLHVARFFETLQNLL
ncbi:MAG: chloramphenicol acetyltransferase [Candidatus Riflebacteria bacterium]